MTVSGTEATMHAMRIARAYTGRDKIVKFEGQYHGVHDYALISVAPGRHVASSATRTTRSAWPGAAASRTPSPTRSSRPATTTSTSCAACSSAQGEEIAAIIVEPVLGNAQGILPKPGFHQAMRALTEEFGILLIFDEVKTGFRFARGGAAEFFGITPDLATYAKAMGNGYPAAAFGGRDEVMSVLPDKVSHGGTYAGNRVAAAAAVKTLDDPPRHGRARDDPRHRAGAIQDGLREVLNPTRPAVRLHRPPVDVRDHVHRGGRRPSTATGPTRTTSCTTRSPSGCTPAARCPSPTRREPWFICEAHAAGRHRRPGRRRSSRTRSTRRSRPGPTARSVADADGAHVAPGRRLTRSRASDGPRRQRRPLGRPGGGPAAGPRRRARARPA